MALLTQAPFAFERDKLHAIGLLPGFAPVAAGAAGRRQRVGGNGLSCAAPRLGRNRWRVEENVIHDITDGVIRHNDNRPEDQSWGKNYFVRVETRGHSPCTVSEARETAITFTLITSVPWALRPTSRVSSAMILSFTG